MSELVPLARGSQEEGFTQPRAHLKAQLCSRPTSGLGSKTQKEYEDASLRCNLLSLVFRDICTRPYRSNADYTTVLPLRPLEIIPPARAGDEPSLHCISLFGRSVLLFSVVGRRNRKVDLANWVAKTGNGMESEAEVSPTPTQRRTVSLVFRSVS